MDRIDIYRTFHPVLKRKEDKTYPVLQRMWRKGNTAHYWWSVDQAFWRFDKIPEINNLDLFRFMVSEV
jgi:hypothetical protein